MRGLNGRTGLACLSLALTLLSSQAARATHPPRQQSGGQQPCQQTPAEQQQQGQDDDDQDESRKLWDVGLKNKRPPGKATAPRRYTYRRVTPRVFPAQKKADKPAPAGNAGKPARGKTTAAKPAATNKKPAANKPAVAAAPTPEPADATPGAQLLGLTFWKLRPSRSADPQEVRQLVQDPGGEGREYTPERIESCTPLGEGQLVRISVESPEDGFLYIFDRERYADGTLGDPYLIFPTSRTRGGDNAVRGGVVVEIPAQHEPAFRIKPSRPDQVAEELTIIVSPKRLGLPLTKNASKLTPEQRAQLADWEKQWAAPFERHEQEGGSGTAYTVAEKRAGAVETRQLTQDDPLPQTIYRVARKPAAPLLVTVPLNFAQPKTN